MAEYEYIELAKIEIKDKYYTDEICKALEYGGYHTALIYDGALEQSIRVLKKKEE